MTIHKPTDFFRFRKNELCAESVPLRRIAERVGTPTYVYSKAALLRQLRALQRALQGLDYLICFSTKANSNQAFLRLFSGAGAGLDVVSGGELFRAIRSGVPSEKIVYSGVGKTREELTLALRAGIRCFNVESLAELEQLNELARRNRTTAPVAFRFNPDIEAGGHPHVQTGRKDNKFGLLREEILEICENWRRFRWLRLQGISVHVGSQILKLRGLDRAFGRTRILASKISRILGQDLALVDVGGGLGVPYDTKEGASSIESYCALIHKHFGKKSDPTWRGGRPLVILEPGRLLTANSGVLVSRVILRKRRASGRGRDFLVLDTGMNDLVRPALYDSYHEIVPARKWPNRRISNVDVVGPICESADCFGVKRRLPEDLDCGDLVAVLSAGAYGYSMGSTYNSRPRPAEVLVSGSRYRVISRRETDEDLIRLEQSVGR